MLSGRSGVTPRKLRYRALLSLLVVLISGAFSAAPSFAQDDAAIRGTLSDATGSAIAGSSVKIKNLETGSLRTLTTDDSGRYDAPALAVGAYEVSAEKAGFQPARAKVNLVLGQRATRRSSACGRGTPAERPGSGDRDFRRCDDHGNLWTGRRAPGERSAVERPQLRSTGDAQSWSGELHLAACGRYRYFKFSRGQYVFSLRPPAPGKSLLAQRRRVYGSFRDQQHSGWSERPTSGRRCCPRIFGGERRLWSRIRQAPRGANQYRYSFRFQWGPWQRVRISAQ